MAHTACFSDAEYFTVIKVLGKTYECIVWIQWSECEFAIHVLNVEIIELFVKLVIVMLDSKAFDIIWQPELSSSVIPFYSAFTLC